MPRSAEERAARYYNYAAFLHRLANQTSAETARARLRLLAEQFERLAARIKRATLAV